MRGNVEILNFLVPSLENGITNREVAQVTDQMIYEMKDYLAMIRGYQQLVNFNNPEIQKIEYWDQITNNIDAMVERLFIYEEYLHKEKQASC